MFHIPGTTITKAGVVNTPNSFHLDGSQVTRFFTGDYTIAQVRGILNDMLKVEEYIAEHGVNQYGGHSISERESALIALRNAAESN